MDWTHVIARAKSRNNLTQPKLAALSGCSQACISLLERGKTRDPSYSVGTKLMELANCGVQESAGNTAAAPATDTSDTSSTEKAG